MKTLYVGLGCLALTRLIANAQTSAVADSYGQSSASQPAYSVVAQDGNSCVWQRTVNEVDAKGQVVAKNHSYTQLDAGMNHLVNGQWVPSKEEIDVLPDGTAAATNGQYQAFFPANIYDGAVSMITVDGQTLQSRPALLCYVDGTNSVVLGDMQSSDGELLGSNQVVYPNAFEGLNADLRYTYKKGSFEQDVVLREQPPTPESFGLNPKTTRIEVLTEFFNVPQPSLGDGVYDQASGLQDTTISFGDSRLILGKAFSTTNSAQKAVEGATVFKSWLEFQGRTFLVEKLPYARVAPQISSLPLQSSLERKTSSSLMASLTPSAVPLLPAQRSINACTNSILLAKADYNQKPGLVLDYVSLNVVVQNFTFQADTTYFMSSSGYFAIEGSAVFEGNTVIKFAAGSGNFQLIYASNISWLSSPYRPIILTAQDDNSVGETISGSTGTPSGYYGSGITIDSGDNLVFHDVRMSYLSTAFILYDNYSEFDNVQVLNCQNPILHAFAGATVNNGLFYNISGAAFTAISLSTPVSATQLTVDQCNLFADTNTSALTVMNSLVTATTNLLGGTGTLSTNQVIILASNTGVYQTVGAGSHYLANSSIYRGVGTNAVGSTVLANLATHTTYPPLVYSNQTFTISTNLPLFARRDTNASPDLGYHYDPLDYITDNLTVTYVGLTITNGVAIACYNRAGIILQGGASIYSVGTPIAPNWFVRYQSVQDQSKFLGGTNVFFGQNVALSSGSTSATGIFQFTHFATPADGGFVFSDNSSGSYANLTVQHSELWGGTNDFSGPTGSATVLVQNDLFFRSAILASNSSASADLAFTNNLIYGTTISLMAPPSGAWFFFNNDVDSCTVASASVTTNGFNAFINCSTSFVGISNIVSTNVVGYLSGPLGAFYQPPTSPLIQSGSTVSGNVGLYAFTTQTNQTEETNAIVDIGYHYVALGTNGLPLITNTNGIPDYILYGGTYGGFDTNGLPYWWEILYFGHTGVNPSADPENDGLTNLQKYQDGLNPNVDQSTVSSTRLNYTYDAGGWLYQVSGIHAGSISFDNEGNLNGSSQ